MTQMRVVDVPAASAGYLGLSLDLAEVCRVVHQVQAVVGGLVKCRCELERLSMELDLFESLAPGPIHFRHAS